ncbi:MAG TPA: 1,4-dihydroxy-2-naphthoate octaprenyltransferase [Anaerolineae bacterium]|nr:1,4-dihydroxy-2-naphthoate octaprenyltransferase [Anaerolineae bacterium]
MSRSKFNIWLEEIRAPFFTATIVPVVLGAVIAWVRTGAFHWGAFLLTLLAGLCLHAGTNVINDYFDHLSGNDEINVEFVRPFTGGSRMIQKGLLQPQEVLRGALIFFALGSIIGLYLACARGPVVLILGLIGLFSGFFYTAPPIFLARWGIGELVVGVNFGVLMTLGSYYVQTRALAWEPVVASIPVTLLIAGVLYINEFQDAPADQAVGKTHLVVRLGRRRAVVGYEIIMAATYLSIVLGVLTQLISPFALLGLLTLPIALKSVRTARVHYDEYLKLAPANAGTVMTHLLTGLLLSVGYLVDKVV